MDAWADLPAGTLVYLYDSWGDDFLEAAADWARLTYADGHIVTVHGFPYVGVYGDAGGYNTRHVEMIDFILDFFGDWCDV